MSAVVQRAEPEAERVPVAQPSETSVVLSMIERIAKDPTVDIERVERMMMMHREMRSERASEEFCSALSQLQAELPAVFKRGKTDKARYAKFEDVVATVKPHLAVHGFSLNFSIEQTITHVTVTGILRHRAGHMDTTQIMLPVDSGPGRNAVQSIGSSVSYAKRYVASALLNITSTDEDDDGQHAAPVKQIPACKTITEEQADSLRELIKAAGFSEQKLCSVYQIGQLHDLPEAEFAKAVATLKLRLPK